MTRRIAFFGCQGTLPNSPTRRPDAFEHDRQIEALRAGLQGTNVEVVDIDWRAPLEELTQFPLAILGTSWDYTERKDEFVDRLTALEAASVMVCNPASIVRWNADKSYLKEMADRGVPSIPTLWLDDANTHAIARAMTELSATRIVAKRRVGAGAIGQFSFSSDAMPADSWRMGAPAMVQPFLQSICDEGEYSFIFIDGALSHALIKRPVSGDYRVQSLYGGREIAVEPDRRDREQAQHVIDALPFPVPLYARIDMVRGDDGQLRLMEAELIEPYLYPEQGPALGLMLGQAVLRRLDI